jgi:hypothetical protein
MMKALAFSTTSGGICSYFSDVTNSARVRAAVVMRYSWRVLGKVVWVATNAVD